MRYEGRTAIVRRLAHTLLYTNTSRYRPDVRTMARGLGVSTRTVLRDLQALEEAGWPLPPLRPEIEAQTAAVRELGWSGRTPAEVR